MERDEQPSAMPASGMSGSPAVPPSPPSDPPKPSSFTRLRAGHIHKSKSCLSTRLPYTILDNPP